jgi:hypothetical protein
MVSLQSAPVPVYDCMIAEAIFVFNLVGWFVAHNVGKQYNFLEREVTQLEP